MSPEPLRETELAKEHWMLTGTDCKPIAYILVTPERVTYEFDATLRCQSCKKKSAQRIDVTLTEPEDVARVCHLMQRAWDLFAKSRTHGILEGILKKWGKNAR